MNVGTVLVFVFMLLFHQVLIELVLIYMFIPVLESGLGWCDLFCNAAIWLL